MLQNVPEVYLKHCQTSKKEVFESILDTWEGSEYASYNDFTVMLKPWKY